MDDSLKLSNSIRRRALALLTSMLALLSVSATIISCARPSKSESSLTVMTLNVAHGRANSFHQLLVPEKQIRTNLLRISECIARIRPDVVAFQELDGPSVWSGSFDHLHTLSQSTKMPHHFRGEHVKALGLSYGTGFLANQEILEPNSHTFADSFPTPSKGLVWGLIAWPEHQNPEVCIASLHLDFARTSTRIAQANEVCRVLKDVRMPLILMGDFNCASDTDCMRLIARELSLRPFAPEDDQPTFLSSGQRLDWILISPELEFRSYAVVSDSVSDHQPVIARIGFKQQGGN